MPMGVRGVHIVSLIDIDEMGIFLQSANRKCGKSISGVRCREAGVYGHDDKYTLIMAIGSNDFKHVSFENVPGTTAERFQAFIESLLPRLPPFPPKVFLWDNLRAHYSPQVFEAIYRAGHAIRARPPYCPQDGPIEYVFNVIENDLTLRMYQIRTKDDLERHMYNVIAGVGNTDAFFVHCGYGIID